MKTNKIYHSPIICYEVTEEADSYGINVYYSNHRDSDNPLLHCVINNLTPLSEKANNIAKELAKSSALPVHIPELLEEFLSV